MVGFRRGKSSKGWKADLIASFRGPSRIFKPFSILSYPFLKERGIALAMKGELKGEEAVDSREGERVRYRMKETVTFTLPFTSLKRTILLFEKQ